MKKYIAYFVAIGVASVLLAIPFLWNEFNSFDFAKKINSQKTAEYFTSLGALITGATLIMLVRQLDLSRRQHQPNLVLDHVTFLIEQQAEYDAAERKRNVFIRLSKTAYTITNHGNGPATDVEIKWYWLNDNFEFEKGPYGKAIHDTEVVQQKDSKSFSLPLAVQNHFETYYFAMKERNENELAKLRRFRIFVYITYDDNDQFQYNKLYEGFFSLSTNISGTTGEGSISFLRNRKKVYKVGSRKIKLPPKIPEEQ